MYCGEMDRQVLATNVFAAGKPCIGFFDREEIFLEIPSKALADILPFAERRRATSITHHRTRERFIAGRAVLRLLIFGLTGVKAPAVLFAEGSTGPPIDIHLQSTGVLNFSISHSSGSTLIAIIRGKQIGVDIEAVRRVKNIQRLSKYAFSESEAAWLQGLHSSLAESAFFRTWTRKEAVVKYYRGSIAQHMDKFCVPLTNSAGIHRVQPGLRGDTDVLYLHDFELAGGIFGAVCVEDFKLEINIFKIQRHLIHTLLHQYRSV